PAAFGLLPDHAREPLGVVVEVDVDGVIVEQAPGEPVALQAVAEHGHDCAGHPDPVHQHDRFAAHSVAFSSSSACRLVQDQTVSIAASIGSQRLAECSASLSTAGRAAGMRYCHSYSVLTVTPPG